jgi:hypothetical protein
MFLSCLSLRIINTKVPRHEGHKEFLVTIARPDLQQTAWVDKGVETLAGS